MSLYHRLAHFRDTPAVKTGQWVHRGDLLGYCGLSGSTSGPHCHYDISNRKMPFWWSYTRGMSLQQVKAAWVDPAPYIRGDIPMPNTFPRAGWQYLQYVKNGAYYHPGMDLNGINDFGKPVYSPVDGRVVAVFGTSWAKNALKKAIKIDWNHGFGNFVVIEQDPLFKLD
jgi:murein DD-endopeptidase MepM/ murein hydrolase activator NlpD